MSDIALQVENLSKHFSVPRARIHDPRREPLSWRRDRFWALRDVSFSVRRGRTLGVIGLNGSGKSTLLKLLSGVMTPDAGRIQAVGRVGALLELGAGFHPELSGLENIYLNGALLGLTTRDVNHLLPEIIAFSELERFMDMPVKHYSSGMAARLGFAVATRLSPEILLMDETFATGDARFQIKALEHIAWMRGRGHTMLIVSHNLEIIVELADEVLWLDHGRTRLHGPARDVLAEYRRSRVDNISAERMRSSLGIQSVFDDADPERAVIKIENARWQLEKNAECGMKNAELNIQMGETLVLEMLLRHDGPHPEKVAIETAWARDGDNKVLAQSRTILDLTKKGTTECSIRLGPWELIEDAWRGVLAVGPATAEEAPKPFRYFDRLAEAVTVRTLTPNPIELKAVTPFHNQWTIRD